MTQSKSTESKFERWYEQHGDKFDPTDRDILRAGYEAALAYPETERVEPEGEVNFPAHQDTFRLVRAFSEALMAKLGQAEVKYGYTNGWATEDWETECRRQLLTHVQKGDPLDVAAYAAFCWARGWSTASPAQPEGEVDALVAEALRIAEELERPPFAMDVPVGVSVSLKAEPWKPPAAATIIRRLASALSSRRATGMVCDVCGLWCSDSKADTILSRVEGK